jgi:hypothetical protein
LHPYIEVARIVAAVLGDLVGGDDCGDGRGLTPTPQGSHRRHRDRDREGADNGRAIVPSLTRIGMRKLLVRN